MGELQGYPVLQRPASSCGRAVAQPSEKNASGLTFEEWNPTQNADASQPPVAMLINSSELRAVGFTLREVMPPALESAARGGRSRYGAGLRQLQGMVPKRFVLSADNDNKFRSRCE